MAEIQFKQTSKPGEPFYDSDMSLPSKYLKKFIKSIPWIAFSLHSQHHNQCLDFTARTSCTTSNSSLSTLFSRPRILAMIMLPIKLLGYFLTVTPTDILASKFCCPSWYHTRFCILNKSGIKPTKGISLIKQVSSIVCLQLE